MHSYLDNQKGKKAVHATGDKTLFICAAVLFVCLVSFLAGYMGKMGVVAADTTLKHAKNLIKTYKTWHTHSGKYRPFIELTTLEGDANMGE